MYTLRLLYKYWYYKNRFCGNFKPIRLDYANEMYQGLLFSMIGKDGPFASDWAVFFSQVDKKPSLFDIESIRRYVLFMEVLESFDYNSPYTTALGVFFRHFYFKMSNTIRHLETARTLEAFLKDSDYIMFDRYVYKMVFHYKEIDLTERYYGDPQHGLNVLLS